MMPLARSLKVSTLYFKFLTRQLPSLVLWRLDKFLEEVMNSKRTSHFQTKISWRCEGMNDEYTILEPAVTLTGIKLGEELKLPPRGPIIECSRRNGDSVAWSNFVANQEARPPFLPRTLKTPFESREEKTRWHDGDNLRCNSRDFLQSGAIFGRFSGRFFELPV